MDHLLTTPMNFRFDLSNAAAKNSPEAVIREATRMACFAWCLNHLGHSAYVPKHLIPDYVRNSARYKREPFCSLPASGDADAILVTSEYTPGDVIIKTSVNCDRDAQNIKKCRVFVAHEYHPDVADDERLLPICFTVHDRVVEFMQQSESLTAYLRNDVDLFRDIYRKPVGTIGFIGNGGYGRNDMLYKFQRTCGYGRKCDFVTSTKMPLETRDYLRRVGGYEVGILTAGSTPKCNRHAELALLGVPICTVTRTVRDTPDLTPENCILLSDWDDVGAFGAGLDRLDNIRENADKAYRDGWSCMGHCKLILERLNS